MASYVPVYRDVENNVFIGEVVEIGDTETDQFNAFIDAEQKVIDEIPQIARVDICEVLFTLNAEDTNV